MIAITRLVLITGIVTTISVCVEYMFEEISEDICYSFIIGTYANRFSNSDKRNKLAKASKYLCFLIFGCVLFGKNFANPEDETLSEKQSKVVKNYLNKSWKYLTTAPPDFERSIAYLDSILLLEKYNPQANAMLGILFMQTNPRKAVKYLILSLNYGELEKDFPEEIYLILGRAYHLLYKLDSAEYYYRIYKSLLEGDRNKIRETWNIVYLALFGNLEGNLYRKKVYLTNPIKIIDKYLEEVVNCRQIIKDSLNVNVINLGPPVNSVYPEFSPVLSKDGTIMYFTSRRPENMGNKKDMFDGLYYEDIWYVHKLSDSSWSQPINMGDPINTDIHESVIALSSDDNVMYIYKSVNAGDIYISRRQNGNWTAPEPLPKSINSVYSEKSIAIFPDGKKILFVSTRPGGYGGRDIWVAERDEKGRWNKIYNAGPTINTPYDEDGIFLSPDGKVLYFSSKGHNTMGGYDIFKSMFEGDKWTKPVNLGYPINSASDDIYFVITADGKYAYFSSNRPGSYGEKDIYMVEIGSLTKTAYKLLAQANNKLIGTLENDEFSANIHKNGNKDDRSISLIKAYVYNNEGKPINGHFEIIDKETGQLVRKGVINYKTGQFLTILPTGKEYIIVIRKREVFLDSVELIVPHDKNYEKIEVKINVREKEIPFLLTDFSSATVLEKIYFDFDEDTPKPEEYSKLDKIVEYLRKNPNVIVEIAGHTDNVGTHAYNMKLSYRRAERVAKYLIKKGIEPTRLKIKAYGEKIPVSSNTTEEGRALNRRVEIRIITDKIDRP